MNFWISLKKPARPLIRWIEIDQTIPRCFRRFLPIRLRIGSLFIVVAPLREHTCPLYLRQYSKFYASVPGSDLLDSLHFHGLDLPHIRSHVYPRRSINDATKLSLSLSLRSSHSRYSRSPEFYSLSLPFSIAGISGLSIDSRWTQPRNPPFRRVGSVSRKTRTK